MQVTTSTATLAAVVALATAARASAGLITGHIDTDAEFNALGLVENAVAQGRIGNNALNGTQELDLGLTSAAPAQVAQFVWGNGAATPFSLSFAPGSGIVTFEVGGNTLTYSTVDAINGIYIRTRATLAGSSVSVGNLELNGDAIAGSSSANGSGDGTDYFFITGNQLLAGFTLSGDATLAWDALPANSNLAFQFKLTVPSPGAAAPLALAGLAAARRRRTA